MIIAGILAGGIGTRMGQYSVPKQFLLLKDKPLVVHTVEKFLICAGVDIVIIAVHVEWLQFMEDIVNKYFKNHPKVRVVVGGSNRNDTIKEIIRESKGVGATGDDIILTHDAVRPFVSLRIIEDNIQAAKEFGVCDTVVPATDTIVQSQDGKFISDIPPRVNLFQGQTPQSFRIGLYEEMIDKTNTSECLTATDVCKLFNINGYMVKLVEGDVSNMKLTYSFDYKIAQIMLGDTIID